MTTAKTAKTEPAADPAPVQADREFWQALTAPFADDEIELLPRPFSKDSPKGTCNQPDRDGHACGGYHALPAMHLTYVGHAGITTRLNEVCSPAGWDWEPYTDTPEGLPGVKGGLWIRLTITTPSGARVTKIGYGDAPGKSGDTTKELIGDAIRNAAMRFGVGTYLWSKSDRAKATLERGDASVQEAPSAPQPPPGPQAPAAPAQAPQEAAQAPAAGISAARAGRIADRLKVLSKEAADQVRARYQAAGGPSDLRHLTDEQADALESWIAEADEPPF